MFKTFRRFFAYQLVQALVRLAEILPRRFGRAGFGALGRLAFSILKGSRKIALANLKLVYGPSRSDRDIRDTAKATFTNLGRIAFDAARMRKQTSQGLEEIVTIVGRHHLDDAMAKGRGTIAITGHVGNWELLGAYLSLNGYPLNVIATGLNNGRLNRVLVDLRRSAGLKVIDRSRGIIGALRCLKRGEVLGILVDLDTSVESVLVDFLGHPAKTGVGVAKLAARTGAPVVPMAMLMTDDGNYEIVVHDPVELSGEAASLEADVERCSKAVEDFIVKEPTQWAWMHKRWKSVFSDMYA